MARKGSRRNKPKQVNMATASTGNGGSGGDDDALDPMTWLDEALRPWLNGWQPVRLERAKI